MNRNVELSGAISIGGVVSMYRFYGENANWQQWGASPGVLAERVDILEAMADGMMAAKINMKDGGQAE